MRQGPILAGSLLIVVALAAPAAAQAPFTAGFDATSGARVFDDKGCVRCHTTNPADGGKAGPNLANTPRPRTFFDLAAALWNHAPQMSGRIRGLGLARPRLDARESGDLAAFLYSIDYFEHRGRADAGRRLFAEKRCAVCHAVGGTGGSVGPPLDRTKAVASPIYVATLMWNHGPQMAEAMKTRGVERPTFKPGELTDLIAYLDRASPPPAHGPVYVLPGRADAGLRVFTEKRCIECHTIGAGAKPGTINLSERAGRRSVTEFAAAMWNKAPAMHAEMASRGIQVPAIAPEEMADLVALLYSVQYFARAGDPAKGVAVATAKGCFGCHGLYGERGKPAGDLAAARGLETPASILAGLWNHTFIDDPRPPDARRELRRLSGDEMADLVAYLRSLRRPR
jgi:mono/diheme cytochrome c family protein